MRIQTYERVLFALLLSICTTVQICAQGVPYRVVLRDKGPISYAPGTPAYQSLLQEFSTRALERRQRMGITPLVNSIDAPIYEQYLRELQSSSIRIVLQLPWFNSVVVEATVQDSARLARLPFVQSVTPVSRRSYQPLIDVDCSASRYGSETIQHDVLRTPLLHNAGIYGTDVVIGVIDTGFRWKGMSTLSNHLRVLEEIDLIQGDSTTANDSLDPSSQDQHGSMVLSVLAGWQHDSLIGMAPFASYILAKTEDMRYEHRIEEEAYACVVMMLERRGVDIITSSLGYRTFDDGQDSTRYEDLDGSTTWASRALNLAASRGVICVTSAGNDGPSGRSIITPADADSVITIGALAPDGVSPWTKSSWGPTASGRQKPDFAVPGVQIWSQVADNTFARPSGTSISAPMFAGGVALLRELYPAATPWAIRDALQRSAQRGSQPDSVAGFGAPDITKAASLLGPSVSIPVVSTIDAKRSVFASVFSESSVRAQLIVRDPITGTTTTSSGVRLDNPWYVFPIEQERIFRDVMEARIEVTQENSNITASYPRDSSWFMLPRNSLVVPCGVRLPGSVTSVQLSVPASDLRISNHPLHTGDKCIDVIGQISERSDVMIVNAITGASHSTIVHRQTASGTTICSDRMLSRGAYLLVITTSDSTSTIPLLVQ